MSGKLKILLMASLTLMASGQAYASGQTVPDNPWAATWASYFAQNKTNGSGGSAGTTNDIQAHILTIERRIADGFVAGFDFKFENQEQKQDAPPPNYSQPGRLFQESYEANFFTRYTHGPFSIEPNIRFGLDDYELDRPDTISNTGLVGKSESNGYHVGFYLELAALLPLTEHIFLRPVASYDYEYKTVDPFKETGVAAGPLDFNIAFDRLHDRRAIGEVGMGLGAQLPLGDKATITPFVVGKYRRNFITGSVETNASIGSNSLGKLPLASGQEKEGFLLDTGAFISGTNNMELWAVYRGQYFPNSTRHGIAGQAVLKF